jgi:hypothetical protein
MVRPASLNSSFATHAVCSTLSDLGTNGKINPMIRFIGRITWSGSGCWQSLRDDSLSWSEASSAERLTPAVTLLLILSESESCLRRRSKV